MTKKLPLAEVKHIPFYGQSFPFVPWKFATKIRISLVFARRMFTELGVGWSLLFWLQAPVRMLFAYSKHREGIVLTGQRFGLLAGIEWLLLIVIFRAIERRSGTKEAYRFAKDAMQECSIFLMPEYYQVDHLARFEDPFEAFWAYHKAMFSNDPNYPNEFVEDGDVRMMIVHSCRNCEIANKTIPELATIGCDHDITGYRAIEDITHMQFRRPKTLAKDGEPCRFMFYRAGTAPSGPYENH